MSFLKPRTWTIGEIACLKWSSILLGVVAGAHFATYVTSHTWFFVILIVAFALKPLAGYFKKP